MRTTYYTATTLDGFLADEHDSLDWLFAQDAGPEDGPWGYARFIADIGALVMGATTYEWVRANLAESGEAWPYEQPTWVMTHRDLPAIAGADVRFAAGAVEPVYAAMAEAADGRDLWVVGGGELACAFAAAGLLDAVVVSVAPVTLGRGRPLFPQPFDLRLVDVGRAGDFACARYDVVGARG